MHGDSELAHHSLYWSFHRATQPSGTLGGGGPDGASKSAIPCLMDNLEVEVSRIVGELNAGGVYL